MRTFQASKKAFFFLISCHPVLSSPRWREALALSNNAKPSLVAGSSDLDSAKHRSTCVSEPTDSPVH